jgi:NAD(P)-dependent dehydrogenase (short-subunit alcohol dehydrogenase family)
MARVVITGGNRGIGSELAKAYAAAGDEVILGIRNPDAVGTSAYELLTLDVSNDDSVSAFAQLLNGRPVDILINNAGIIGPERQSARDADFDGFLQTLNVNSVGPLRVTQALLPNLEAATGAKVVIISSRMGSLSGAEADQLAYRASKAAVNKVARGLATELAQNGIAVASLHPGWVRTDMGGAGADIAPEESAQGIKNVIDQLTLDGSGRFWGFDGAELDW